MKCKECSKLKKVYDVQQARVIWACVNVTELWCVERGTAWPACKKVDLKD